MIIDLDDYFCIPIDDDIIDFDKLNKILTGYMINGNPMKDKPLTDDEKNSFLFFLYQISYINQTFDRFWHLKKNLRL